MRERKRPKRSVRTQTHTQKKQSEFECEDILLLHTQKNRVRACAPLEHEFECEDILLLHTQKNRVSLRLSLCASGACEEKAKVKCSYSNPQKKQSEFEFECEDILLLHTQTRTHSGPLCPEQESLTAVRQGTCTIFLIK